MRAIIFGANGQDGFYLSQLLKRMNVDVTGVSRSGPFVRADVADTKAVMDLIASIRPTYVFHLAANSTTRHEALFENHATIATGTLNILEAVKTTSPSTKVFISGSGLQFKNEGKPIRETDEFEARDAYSVSRIQSVYAARYYRGLGLDVYVGYFFNHDSPLRSPRHISQLIASTARKIASGENLSLEIGDVSVKKEWTFAGDVVEAIWKLVEQNKVHEATLGTGLAYSIEDYLETCFRLIGKNWKDYTKIKEGFRAEYKILVSDPSTIFSLGWQPATNFNQIVQMMLYSDRL